MLKSIIKKLFFPNNQTNINKSIYPAKIWDSFEEIKKLNGFLDINAYFLMENLHKAHNLGNKPTLEIGVFCGRSLIGLANIFQTKTVGVDPFFEDFHNEYAHDDEAKYLHKKTGGMTRQERVDCIYKTLDTLDKKNNTKLKDLTKLEIMPQAEFFKKRDRNEKYQAVYIDGEHTYGAVKEAIDQFDNILLPESWIIIDDFFAASFPGIAEAMFTHSMFKKSIFPMFYCFGKAVFMYKPESKEKFITIRNSVTKNYSTDKYHVNKQNHDNSIEIRHK
jgi:hypothetical protein